MVTELNVKLALSRLGIECGDTVIVHSSFKSIGPTERGAQTVMDGLFSAVGDTGTVVFPTLCQKDWEHVYDNWHLDAESDVGYLTNYFRKLPGAKRSDQATHSVAAIGAKADYITETHGLSGKRYGPFGDTPFAADSPWDKMYELNTKIILIGCNIRKATFRHLAEYVFMDKYIKKVEASAKCDELKGQVWTYMKRGIWPHVDPEYVLPLLEAEGKVKRTFLGTAELIELSCVDFVDKILELMNKFDPRVFKEDEVVGDRTTRMPWFCEVENL